jgi:hypothetical protein
MPLQAEHIYKAKNNKRFADAIRPITSTSSGWILTILFYSALHYVEAYNAKFDCHFKNHDDLKRDIYRNPQLSDIFDDYSDLLTFSWNARYRPCNYGEEDVKEARVCYEAVVGHITALLGE